MESSEWAEETWSMGLEWTRRGELGDEGKNTWHEVSGENEEKKNDLPCG
jgi:hypothetical protein